MQIAIFLVGSITIASLSHALIRNHLSANLAAAAISIGGYLLIGALVDGEIDKFFVVAFVVGFTAALGIAAFIGGLFALLGYKR